jgi:O-antigen ligase
MKKENEEMNVYKELEHQKNEKKKFLGGNYFLLPILFVLCIVPLIMRVYIYDPSLSVYPYFPDSDQEIDIFLYWKGVALVIAAIVMVGILAYVIYYEWKSGYTKQRIMEAKWLFPLAGFGLLALLSTLVSKYQSYGFSGMYEQFETIWVVLAYCITGFYTFYFIRKREDVDWVAKGLFFVLTLLALLGVSQVLGHDFWETELGKAIYVPSKYAELKENLSFNFSGSGTHQVYLTFYNPNYIGVFGAIVLPITAMLAAGNKDVKKKLAWGVLTLVLFVVVLGSGSKAFLIALLPTAALGVLFYLRKHLKMLPLVLGIAIVVLVAGGVYLNTRDVNLYELLSQALTPRANDYAMESFTIEEDHVELVYKGEKLSMVCEAAEDGPYFAAWDANDTQIAFTSDENSRLHLEDDRFSDFSIAFYNGYDDYTYITEVILEDETKTRKYAFSKGENGYTYMNFKYVADEIVDAPAAPILKNYDSLFSGRGYMWSRSIPLLGKHLILGSGADSFFLEFPNNDYFARTNSGYQSMLITKPHSLYLQWGIQYGVLALLCYLAIAVIYVVQAVRLCWKTDYKDKYSFLALGIFMGIVGYGILGLTNDSCVALTPMVWVIIGLGFAINRLLKEEMEGTKASE